MNNKVYVFEERYMEHDCWNITDVDIKVFSDSISAISFYQAEMDAEIKYWSEDDSAEIEIENSEEEYYAEFRTEKYTKIYKLYSIKLLTIDDIKNECLIKAKP